MSYVLCYVMLCCEGSDSLCSEQHFCSCPPFLKYSSRQDDQLHFTKHNYDDQYAILGKSKVTPAS